MEFFVCRGYSGQIHRVNLDENLKLHHLLPVLASTLGLYTVNEDRLGIYNLTRDKEYFDSQTLSESGAIEGDLLLIADGMGCHKKAPGH